MVRKSEIDRLPLMLPLRLPPPVLPLSEPPPVLPPSLPSGSDLESDVRLRFKTRTT